MYGAIIIEDDPVMAKLNQTNLEQFKDIKLEGSFRNCFDALTFLETKTIDLILLDFHLPGMNGAEFLTHLRKMNCLSEVIMITMNNDAEAMKKILSFGVIDYVLKPYTTERFKEAINHFIKKEASMGSSAYITQEELDKFLYTSETIQSKRAVRSSNTPENNTRRDLIEYLKARPDTPMTLNQILYEVSLSKVTLRRYMKSFCEEGIVITACDYSTGGRPSMVFTYPG